MAINRKRLVVEKSFFSKRFIIFDVLKLFLYNLLDLKTFSLVNLLPHWFLQKLKLQKSIFEIQEILLTQDHTRSGLLPVKISDWICNIQKSYSKNSKKRFRWPFFCLIQVFIQFHGSILAPRLTVNHTTTLLLISEQPYLSNSTFMTNLSNKRFFGTFQLWQKEIS